MKLCEEELIIYKKAIETFGIRNQINKAIEECSELVKELCKSMQDNDNLQQIIEEIADVSIMLEQLQLIYKINKSELEEYKDIKIKRLKRVV